MFTIAHEYKNADEHRLGAACGLGRIVLGVARAGQAWGGSSSGLAVGRSWCGAGGARGDGADDADDADDELDASPDSVLPLSLWNPFV